jgi:hypothetical protein
VRSKYVFKTFSTTGSPEFIRERLVEMLLSHGFGRTGTSESGAVLYFNYPSIFFSSKRPLTCISRLTLETRGQDGNVRVRIGATFTKIKYFTIFVMSFLWFGIPIVMALLKGGFPDFSPFGGLVIPAGFLVHYTVRGRVFRRLRAYVEKVGNDDDFRR